MICTSFSNGFSSIPSVPGVEVRQPSEVASGRR
jgi:hypothetical protein